MKKSGILSLIVPPFPTFIEGNFAIYSAGQSHPNRNRLPYFDLIFVTRGCLYLTEDQIEYEVHEGEMLILTPHSHHFGTKACQEQTEFYWIHFYYEGLWQLTDYPIQLSSNVQIPELHYHNRDYTIHLNKHQPLSDSEYIYALLEHLLRGTVGEKTSIVFWDNQKRFSQLLKSLEEQSFSKTSAIELAENIELYLKQHYKQPITNEVLSSHFHFHENYLIRCMKQVFQCTPLEYLISYRLEKASNFLIKTNLPVKDISLQCGFQHPAYFSLCFKKKFAISPLAYRKAHTGL